MAGGEVGGCRTSGEPAIVEDRGSGVKDAEGNEGDTNETTGAKTGLKLEGTGGVTWSAARATEQEKKENKESWQ